MEERKDSNTGITRITVKGFKSLAREVSVDLAPLTILAGANSSGKSSLLQPLLLLKQTLEASYDPGSLLLSGPNINFTIASQLLSRAGKWTAKELEISLFSEENSIRLTLKKARLSGFEIGSMEYHSAGGAFTLHPGMTDAELKNMLPEAYRQVYDSFSKNVVFRDEDGLRADNVGWTVARERCFLAPQLVYKVKESVIPAKSVSFPIPSVGVGWVSRLKGIIHLPGVRGTPERTYPVAAVESTFSGVFPVYTASVILQWQRDKNDKRLTAVGTDLERLGLAWRVLAHHIHDTQIEVEVSRLPRHSGSARDNVSIADVGLGLSQVLPVVVALHAASPGQLIYLEQPEIHMHPRAQREFANVLAQAVHRGVRIVAETHSSLLLLGVQTAVAQGVLNPSDVCLHWFQRDEEGITSVRSGTLDAAGAFGNWPEDFADVELESESRYLDAADQLKSKVH